VEEAIPVADVVDQVLHDPSTERSALAIAAEVPPCPEERVLQSIIRIGLLAKEASANYEQPRAMRLEELQESFGILQSKLRLSIQCVEAADSLQKTEKSADRGLNHTVFPCEVKNEVVGEPLDWPEAEA
jgi:hypothetical protein